MNKYQRLDLCSEDRKSKQSIVSSSDEPRRLGSEAGAGMAELQDTVRKAGQWQARVWGTPRRVWYAE